ncbi:MAG: hypothetical protein COV75_03900 [Candidatus Omnitrophica bacterium CG11_big_fil_rev_8_21_14_0_20_63_9]|nr:MAG: hypothetical protein COV75_03900 [Candidatus Omnitrophica bacterium CG11_big_fil_rev_8_21_14_0_20_63_9]
MKPRERRLALIAGVLIGCWVIVSLLIQPLGERTQALGERIQTDAEKLSGLQSMLLRQVTIERRYARAAAYLSYASAEEDHREFLDVLEELSRTAELKLNLKPRPARLDGRLVRMEIELDVEGSQANLLVFLDQLLRMPKLLVIERLRISVIPTRTDTLRANLVVQALSPSK